MGINLPGPFEWGRKVISHGTHNAPLFPTREISLPWLENYRTLDLAIVGNEGPLMLMCSNVHVSRGSPIFCSIFNATYRLKTPIKCHRVMESFVPLTDFEFAVGMYG